MSDREDYVSSASGMDVEDGPSAAKKRKQVRVWADGW